MYYVHSKRDPQMVRAFLGLTPDNLTLNNAERLLKKPITINRVDPEYIDDYFEQVDKFIMGVSSVDALSYEARTDFASIENNNKQSALEKGQNSDDNEYLHSLYTCHIC